MSLVEGHGDVIMDRAGAAEVPGAAHFSRVLQERRSSARGLTKLVPSSSASRPRCASTPRGSSSSSRWRRREGRRCWPGWEGPEWLPTLEEIRDPAAWVARAGG